MELQVKHMIKCFVAEVEIKHILICPVESVILRLLDLWDIFLPLLKLLSGKLGIHNKGIGLVMWSVQMDPDISAEPWSRPGNVRSEKVRTRIITFYWGFSAWMNSPLLRTSLLASTRLEHGCDRVTIWLVCLRPWKALLNILFSLHIFSFLPLQYASHM